MDSVGMAITFICVYLCIHLVCDRLIQHSMLKRIQKLEEEVESLMYRVEGIKKG